MSHFDYHNDFFDFEEDNLFDLMIDQLHQFAEMMDDYPHATASPGPVAQLDRATAF